MKVYNAFDFDIDIASFTDNKKIHDFVLKVIKISQSPDFPSLHAIDGKTEAQLKSMSYKYDKNRFVEATEFIFKRGQGFTAILPTLCSLVLNINDGNERHKKLTVSASLRLKTILSVIYLSIDSVTDLIIEEALTVKSNDEEEKKDEFEDDNIGTFGKA